MDGVIADFEKGMLDLGLTIDIKDGGDYEKRSEIVHKVCLENPDVFHKLEPIEGSIEAVHHLFDNFEHFEILFLSTPMWLLPESFSGKRIWIEQHFGEKAKDRLILSRYKHLNVGDYLIDDTTRNGAGEFTGEHIHFGTDKFPNWNSVIEYLTNKHNNI